MSDTDPLDGATSGREPLRAALALVCILAVVFAAATLPALPFADAAEAGNPDSEDNGTEEPRTPGERTSPQLPGGGGPGSGAWGDGPSERGRPGRESGGTPSDSDRTTGEPSDGRPSGGQRGESDAGNRTGGETGDATGSSDTGNRTSGGGADGQREEGDIGNRTSGGEGRTGQSGGGNATERQGGGERDQSDDRDSGPQSRDGNSSQSGDGEGRSQSGDGNGGESGDGNSGESGDGNSGESDGGDSGSQSDEGDSGQSGDGNSGESGEGEGGESGDGNSSESDGGDSGSQSDEGDSGQSGDGNSGESGDGNGGESGDGDGGESGDGNGDGDGGESGDGDGGQSGDGNSDESGEGDSGETSNSDSGSQSGDEDSEESEDGEDGQSSDDDSDQSDDGNEDPQSEGAATGYAVSLNRSATAGAVVEVTVTRGGDPAAGVAVSFNGDPVGRTDAAGTVVGRVPYESQLTITIDSGAQGSLPPPRGVGGQRQFSLAAPRTQATNDNESFAVDTNVTLSLSGSVATGRNVSITATVDDVPVRSAAVTVDGRRVGTTDDSGRATVPLPAEPGNYTVAVERDSVRGERTVTLSALAVETEPALPLALPGTGLDVRVTAGGDPVPNATVALGGEQVAVTDSDGSATVPLPVSDSATLTVRADGQTNRRVVDGLLRNLAGILVGVVALVVGTGYLLGRRGVSRATVAGWLRHTTQLAVNTLLWLGRALDGAIGRLRARVRLTIAALRAVLAGRRTPAQLWTALRGWVADRLAAAKRSADAAATADRRPDGTARNRTTVRAAWGRFVGTVSLARTRTATPGEIAAHAIEEDGIPPEAVGTLREAYRAVEYGQYDPDDHVAAVEQAIETIERSVDPDDDTRGETP